MTPPPTVSLTEPDGQPACRHSLLESLPMAVSQPWVGYGAAVALTAVALGIRLMFAGVLPSGFPFLTFFPAVVLTAFLFGRGPGIACAILSGVAAWYYLLPPFGTFAIDIGNGMAMAFYVLVVAVDLFLIDLSQRFAKEILRERETNRQLAETRQVLFRELQHRVSNNLQVIGALLSAQRRRVTDPEARLAIEEAATRLTVIGQISRELYLPDGGQADMAEFLRRLIDAVLQASGRSDVTCSLNVPPALTLAPDQAVPLALVMTEALSNALEHGLPARAGVVVVSLKQDGPDRLVLSVEDDGHGLPPGFSLEAADQLGLRIAGQLAKQLGGSFSLAPRAAGAGTCATLTVAA